uniref:Uncharacterized protein n=1 Tax=Globodera rostochiensis TaxID=31243 RepID=A0A914HHF1_GLORO
MSPAAILFQLPKMLFRPPPFTPLILLLLFVRIPISSQYESSASYAPVSSPVYANALRASSSYMCIPYCTPQSSAPFTSPNYPLLNDANLSPSGYGTVTAFGNQPSYGNGGAYVIGNGAYGNQPSYGNGYGAQPVIGNGAYGNQPSYGNGYGAQPIGNGAYGNQPSYSNGYGAQPVIGNEAYSNQPTYGSGYGAQPVIGNGAYSNQPSYARGNGYGNEPLLYGKGGAGYGNLAAENGEGIQQNSGAYIQTDNAFGGRGPFGPAVSNFYNGGNRRNERRNKDKRTEG